MNAICIKCGAEKVESFHRCEDCGFNPEGQDDLVKSIYCSLLRVGEDGEEAQIRSGTELALMGEKIRCGEGIAYDEAELRRIRSFLAKETKSIQLLVACFMGVALILLIAGGLLLPEIGSMLLRYFWPVNHT